MGVKINTPHYLAKLENVPRGSSSYTVIVSQLESLSAIYYTLRVSVTYMYIIIHVYMYLHVLKYLYMYMYMYSLFPVITNGPESIKQSLRRPYNYVSKEDTHIYTLPTHKYFYLAQSKPICVCACKGDSFSVSKHVI